MSDYFNCYCGKLLNMEIDVCDNCGCDHSLEKQIKSLQAKLDKAVELIRNQYEELATSKDSVFCKVCDAQICQYDNCKDAINKYLEAK